MLRTTTVRCARTERRTSVPRWRRHSFAPAQWAYVRPSSAKPKRSIERAARLAAGHPETIFCADNAQNVRDLNDAAGAAKVRINVAIDLWVGRRTGIQPGEAALRLGQLIDSLPNLKFAGLQAYAGYASH